MDDEFTARLQAQPPAELPAHWRTEILAAATNRTAPSGGIGAWLWPHPLAYAGLAAAWVLILVMRLATPTPQPAEHSPAAGLVTNGLPLFESMRLASQESPWDP